MRAHFLTLYVAAATVGLAGLAVRGAVHLVPAQQVAGRLGQVPVGGVAAVHRPLVEEKPGGGGKAVLTQCRHVFHIESQQGEHSSAFVF